MPDIAWNRRWAAELAEYLKDSSGEAYYGYRWGRPHKVIRTQYIDPYTDANSVVLEIGPGGGRYTEYLLHAKKLILVELNPEFFPYLLERFPDAADRLCFYPTAGTELGVFGDQSIDFVFSFDVFVHLALTSITEYLFEIRRVLRFGGKAVIHYGDVRKITESRTAAIQAGGNNEFFGMSPEFMERRASLSGLSVVHHDCEFLGHSNIVVLEG